MRFSLALRGLALALVALAVMGASIEEEEDVLVLTDDNFADAIKVSTTFTALSVPVIGGGGVQKRTFCSQLFPAV